MVTGGADDPAAMVTRTRGTAVDYGRLGMPVGEAIFTQPSIRKFRPDSIPIADLRLVLEAAVRAPTGGNSQIGRSWW
jgi:hypothetical protein